MSIQTNVAKLEDACIGLLSCLRTNLLQVGGLAKQSGVIPGHFPAPLDAAYSVMIKMWEEGRDFDWIEVLQRMRANGAITRDADKDTLRDILYSDTLQHAALFHITTILECAAARKMFELGSRLVARALDPAESTSDLLDEIRQQMTDISIHRQEEDTHLSGFVTRAISSMQSIVIGGGSDREVIKIGLGLDKAAGPFMRSDLVVISGQTKGGKSALAGNIIENVAEAGGKVAVFSLEMSGVQNAERMLASQALVDTRKLKLEGPADRGLFTKGPTEFDRLAAAAKRMESWQVRIFEKTRKIDQMVAEMRRMKMTTGLDLAVVDYAQLVKGIRNDGDNREREVASISATLKEAASSMDCLVILLSQLNEAGKLRESRALGQDANCILAIEELGEGRLIRVVAARSAPASEIPITWQKEFTKFSEQ